MIKSKIKTIVRKFIRRAGFDIISYNLNRMGLDPYLDMTKLIKSDKPLVFDVGANIGQTVHRINVMFSNYQIHSFEPSPDTFEILKNNTGNINNIDLWNLGLGSSSGTLLLNENSGSDMSSFLELGDRGWGKIVNKTLVEVTTIDKFSIEHNIKKIDILKMDTQGFELEILKGAEESISQNKIGLLYFEVTFINMYKGIPSFSELYDFCINHGFELVSIYPINYRQNMAGWTDVLFKHKSYNQSN